MKLSPIWLFLILLIVLIFSVLFIKKTHTSESFINFYSKTPSNTTNLTIPNYTNPVDKLYDSDFFDPRNGNVLRVYGTAKDDAKPDNEGSTIDHIDVIDRSAFVNTYQKGEKIPSGTLTSVPNSYSAWTVYSTDISFANITSNQIIYCAWDQDTYLHLIDLNNKLNACSFLYSLGSTSNPVYTNYNAALTKLKTAKIDVNDNNNTYIFDDNTNMIFYQLTSNIFYAPLNGDLMMQDSKGINIIYSRSGTAVSNFSNIGVISSTTPWIQYDLVGQFMVIYFANRLKTIIIVMKLNSDNLTYSIVSVSRFLADGSIQKDSNTIIPIPSCVFNKQKNRAPRNPYPMNASVGGSASCNVSGQQAGSSQDYGAMPNNYFPPNTGATQGGNSRQKGYSRGDYDGQGGNYGGQGGNYGGQGGNYGGQGGNYGGQGGNYGYNNQTIAPGQYDDYVLKTQILPPVCPVWPSIVSTCSNCGNTTGGPSANGNKQPPPPPPNTQPPNNKEDKSIINNLTQAASTGLERTGNALNELGEGVGEAVNSFFGFEGEEDGFANMHEGFDSMDQTSTTLPPDQTSTTMPPLPPDQTSTTLPPDQTSTTLPPDQTSTTMPTLPPDQTSTTMPPSPGPSMQIPADIVVPSPVGYYIRNMGATPMTGPMDPFTYNGMLPEKPSSDFLPLTADFSRFGR